MGIGTGLMQKAGKIYGGRTGTDHCNSAALKAAHLRMMGTVGEVAGSKSPKIGGM